MIPNLQPYESYRDSGVPWLGNIPTHWKVLRLKQICTRSALYGANIPATLYTPDGIRFLRTTDFNEDGSLRSGGVHVSEQLVPDQILSDNDILISRSGATVGKSFLYKESFHGPCSYAGYLVRFQLGSMSVPRFVFYFTKSTPFFDFLRVSSIQSTIENVNGQKYANFPISLPPLEEQVAAVRFLDFTDQKISRLIRNKRRLIALLNEEKQAIIQQAVTRGLDPDVPMKPSGVEWLGEIPAHWEIKRNGAIFELRQEPGEPILPILEVSLNTGVTVRDFVDSKRKQMMADLAQYQTARAGDVAYNMMRMWQGAVGVVPVDGLVSPAYVVVRPRAETDSRYFAYLYRTRLYMREVDRHSRGIVKDRNRLYWADYKQMPVIVPPFQEQAQVVEWLAEKLQAIGAVVDRANREIELIREYRTRLIADVVTGHLDVRGAAASLPNIEVSSVDAPDMETGSFNDDNDFADGFEALNFEEDLSVGALN